MHEVQVSDPVPFFADALENAYGESKAIYWRNAAGDVRYLTAVKGDDEGSLVSGLMELRAEEILNPAEYGLVCYKVQIR
ncbi:MAG: hypothetical protein GXN93_02740 [Candidatus Diapherotrites archaeon]|nr:hypothetical protein [Candidatus Diapherotrites archaeon]